MTDISQWYQWSLETKDLRFEGNDQTAFGGKRHGRNALPKLQKEIDGNDGREGPNRPPMPEVR
jgi:hypothetical protein